MMHSEVSPELFDVIAPNDTLIADIRPLTHPLRSLRGVPCLESALRLLLTSTRAYLGSSSTPVFELPALPLSGRGGIGGGGGGGRNGEDSSRSSCSA